MSHWTDPLRGGACADEIKDGRQYDTFAGWWGGTQQSDYMLWILERIEYPDDCKIRLLSCRFIRETWVNDTCTVWDLLTDDRSRSAVVAAEMYAKGWATDEELGSAEGAARDAARNAAARNAAAMAAARTVTGAAARAASAAVRVAERAVAQTAEWAARAAVSAAEWEAWDGRAAACWTRAARVAARDAATKSALAQQADIIRDMIPVEEIAPLFERYIERLQGGDR